MASRTVIITRDSQGLLFSKHHANGRTQTIQFNSPEQLWNYCTLDISLDRQRFARPPMRNRKEEQEAIKAFIPAPQVPPMEDSILLELITSGQAARLVAKERLEKARPTPPLPIPQAQKKKKRKKR